APAANGSPITGYDVTPWVGAVAGVPQHFADTAAGTAQVVSALTNGTTYRFSVTATNALGTSSASASSNPVTVGTPSAPAAPKVALGSGQAMVSWVAPLANGSAITGYVVTPWNAGSAQPAVTVGAAATTAVVTLSAGSTTFTVAGVNANGTGAPSAASVPVTSGAPAAPAAPTATAPGSGQVTLTWAAPATNGSAITGYVVTPYVGTTAQAPFTFGASPLTRTVTGLGTGATYTFTVAAVNAAGTGPESPVSNAATTPHWFCLPSAPTTAADLRTALNHHDARWQGGDGGTAVALPDGRTLWLFGDTMFGTVQPDGSLTTGWGMVHGSILIESGACFDPFYSSTTTRIVPLVPNAADGSYYWPGDGWVSADGTTLNVMVSHVQPGVTSGTAPAEPHGIAVFRLSDLSLVRVDDIPSPPPPATTVGWRAMAYRDPGDHYVYLYDVEGFNHYVVRFPDSTSNFTTADDWEYWTGSAWSLVPADTRAMTVTPGTFVALSPVKTASGYQAVAIGVGADAGSIVGWKAASPTAAWSKLTKIADSPTAGGQSAVYGAHAFVLPGIEPVVVWSRSPVASLSTVGAGLGVAPLPA
ncbi:MAG: hypothetical protein JWN46_2918, partial [Acidimicrobiales bacterium]|nr:hypothetical protein [Acidimicrobiales bacterium]